MDQTFVAHALRCVFDSRRVIAFLYFYFCNEVISSRSTEKSLQNDKISPPVKFFNNTSNVLEDIRSACIITGIDYDDFAPDRKYLVTSSSELLRRVVM